MEHFWDWCSSHDHRDANLLGNQINFLMHDLHNGFARIGAKLAASETAEAAAYQVSRYFSPTIAIFAVSTIGQSESSTRKP
jgi:hypothetical protein